MKILRVVLHSETRIKEIVSVLETGESEKVVFECPRDFGLLSDISVIKRLVSTAKENKKALAFICTSKFIRDILKSQKVEVYSTVIKELEEVESISIEDVLFPKVPLEKKEEELVVERQKKDILKPVFSLKKIDASTHKPMRGKVFFSFLFVIGILVGMFFWVSPRAKIILKPKISVIPVTQNIIVTLPDAEVPEKEKQLPLINGILVETEVIGTEIFPSTGRTYDLTNAKGKITLFNETTQEKFLLPSRLQAPNGVIFRFDKNVTIPPRSVDGPGQLVVEVIADAYDEEEKPIGDRGNIDAGTELFFPALREPLRELYYARANQGPLVGGSTLTHYFLQEGDFEKAKVLLEERFRERGIDQLQTEITNRSEREKKKYVLVDDLRLLVSELIEVQFPQELVGQETQTFEGVGKLKLKGLVFDQTQVSDFLATKLRETQDHTKKLLEIDPLSANYQLLDHENFSENKWLKFSVEMQGVEVLDIDSDSPSALEWRYNTEKEIAGKLISEARGILTNFPEIDQIIDIQVSPFWADTLPNMEERIMFEIRR